MPLPGHRALALISPIALALDAAHAAGLVHRDVKPANILVDISPSRPEHPYLSDFGLAKGAASSTGLTRTGQFLGTLDYAAPEQVSGKPACPQTDQYALACVVYTVLTASLPFPRDEPMAVLWAHKPARPSATQGIAPPGPAGSCRFRAVASRERRPPRGTFCSFPIRRGPDGARIRAGRGDIAPARSPRQRNHPCPSPGGTA